MEDDIVRGVENGGQGRESGRTPTLLPCSRNARPQKGLVRRAAVGATWVPCRDETVRKKGEREKERPGALLARRTRTMKRCSSDARSRGQPWPLPPILGRRSRGRRKERREAWRFPVLAQRAASEGPRWTRARWGQTKPLLQCRGKRGKRVRQRRIQQGPDARSSSRSIPLQ